MQVTQVDAHANIADNAAARTVSIGSRRYPLVVPSIRDPRLHLAAVITTLQVLGQTAFHFNLSITQILTSILTCALLEFVITFATKRVVAWPASAMLTGNGVAFILRVPGTRHGDWWSTNGLWIFAGTAALSLLSKYVIRFRGRHIFNPSNFGLLVCFLALGPGRAEPLDFWWSRLNGSLAFAFVVILIGGLSITRRTRMLEMAAAFWLTFAAGIAVVAATGHCMLARWHVGPICGAQFWWVILTSPEILVFLFFMITDPRTAPAARRGRIVFGMSVALLATFLVAPQRTEYGTKVAVLGALSVLCVLRPFLDRQFAPDDWLRRMRPSAETARRYILGGVGVSCIVIPMIAFAGIHARPNRFTIGDAARREVARPAIAVPDSAIPTVRNTSQKAYANALRPSDVNAIAHDFVADLAITNEALRTRNPLLSATAGDLTWLLEQERAIRDAGSTGPIVAPSYTLDHMQVAVLKRRASQALPEIDVIVDGTQHRVTYDESHVASRSDVPFRRTYVVAKIGAHYLITADRSTT
jgi:Na+-translocating ferredoxin:NAD+ oxidoreductase RnfD subunit